MSKRSILEDLAAIVVPDPGPDDIQPPEMRDEVLPQLREEAERERRAFITERSERWDSAIHDAEDHDFDPVLDEIARAAVDMSTAEARMRLLIAYARNVVRPRPYRLGDLAHASGMSISGVRTAYSNDEINQVRRRLGLGHNEPFDISPN